MADEGKCVVTKIQQVYVITLSCLLSTLEGSWRSLLVLDMSDPRLNMIFASGDERYSAQAKSVAKGKTVG